nr:ribonuclease H-like domain-containing protein [Tanacetum cinerariifolium]
MISNPPQNSNLASVHPMVTRYRVGNNLPTQRLSLHVSSVLPLPKSYRDAFSDSNWKNAMYDEYHALIINKTWTLVPRPTDTNIVRCMWLFRHKYHAYGTLSHHKALLVANGSTQLVGVDDKFSLVVKPGTIRTVLSLATSRHWLVHQLVVKNDFLHAVYVRAQATPRGMFLSERKYAVEILEREHMLNSNSSRTHVDTESKLEDDGDPVSDLSLYARSLGASFAALKRILRCGTLDYELQLFSSSTTDLVAYSDADWDVCPTMRRSTSGHCVFLGNNLLSWSSKRQPTLSRSSVEAEYRGVANDVAKICWLRNLLRDLYTPLSSTTLVYCDNYVVSFTRGLPSAMVEEFHTSLSVGCPLALTVGESPARTKNMMMGKWTRMHGDCQRLNAINKHLTRKSGENDVDLVENAKTTYMEQYGNKKVHYVHVWNILKNHPKWNATEPMDEDNLQKLFGPDPKERPAGKQRASKKQISIDTPEAAPKGASGEANPSLYRHLFLRIINVNVMLLKERMGRREKKNWL